jgi:hypothetical protein
MGKWDTNVGDKTMVEMTQRVASRLMKRSDFSLITLTPLQIETMYCEERERLQYEDRQQQLKALED